MFKKIINKSSVRKKSYGRFIISFLFLITFFLILFNKTDYYLINSFKNNTIDFVTPVTKIISTPITFLNNASSRIKFILISESENLKLKEEIIRLKKWQTLAIKNSRENRVLKRLLNSTSHEVEVIKTASIINQSPGMYSRVVTINAGNNFNLEKNLAVINEKGLVGKIIFVSNNNSRVLLISDPTSSIPVKALSDNSYSILTGTSNGKYLKSSFIKNNEMPKIGDLLVTSGNTNLFPRDVLVAKVIELKENYYIAIPYVDFNNLNYIQVVKSK